MESARKAAPRHRASLLVRAADDARGHIAHLLGELFSDRRLAQRQCRCQLVMPLPVLVDPYAAEPPPRSCPPLEQVGDISSTVGGSRGSLATDGRQRSNPSTQFVGLQQGRPAVLAGDQLPIFDSFENARATATRGESRSLWTVGNALDRLGSRREITWNGTWLHWRILFSQQRS